MSNRDTERRQQRRRLDQPAKPDLKQLLLAPEERTDALTPPRAERRRRSPEVIE